MWRKRKSVLPGRNITYFHFYPEIRGKPWKFFGGLAGCIVKYFIYRSKKTRQKREEGKKDGYI